MLFLARHPFAIISWYVLPVMCDQLHVHRIFVLDLLVLHIYHLHNSILIIVMLLLLLLLIMMMMMMMMLIVVLLLLLIIIILYNSNYDDMAQSVCIYPLPKVCLATPMHFLERRAPAEHCRQCHWVQGSGFSF